MSARAARANVWTRSRRLLVATLLGGAALNGLAGEPTPVNVRTAPGRFEIAAIDATAAHTLAAAAEEAWQYLAAPLSLPDAFPTPIFVRVIPGTALEEAVPFRVTVESGGIVSLRLATAMVPTSVSRRALVQALLMRLAVAQHGATERLTAPLWLEHACVGWWETHREPAQLDALKYESRRMVAPPLTELAAWQRGEPEGRPRIVGAIWLLAFMQTESGHGREWVGALTRLLAGEELLDTLATTFPGRFRDAVERELWWQTGFQHLRRVRSLPALEAADSRQQLEALTRFVFNAPTTEADVVVPLAEIIARAAEPIVAAELKRRSAELNRVIPALHPFYRNAGLTLSDVFASRAGKADRRAALCSAFEQDWQAAIELETASTAALDALEKGAP